ECLFHSVPLFRCHLALRIPACPRLLNSRRTQHFPMLPQYEYRELTVILSANNRQRKFSTSIRSQTKGSNCENRTYRPSGETLRPIIGESLMSNTFSAVSLAKLKTSTSSP